MIVAWHRSIYLFHRKHLAARYAPWLNALICAGMAGSVALALARWLVVSLPSGLGAAWPKRLASAFSQPYMAWRGKLHQGRPEQR